MTIISTSNYDYYIYTHLRLWWLWWLLYLHPVMTMIATSNYDYCIYIRLCLLHLRPITTIISTSNDDCYDLNCHPMSIISTSIDEHSMLSVIATAIDDYYICIHWWLLYLHSLMTIISTTSVRRRHHPGIAVTVDFTGLHYPAHMQFSITLPRRPITRITLRRMQGLFVLFWFWLHRGVFVCVLGWEDGGSDPVW